MFKLIGQLLRWLRGGSLKLLLLAGVILLIWGTLAPIGTLVWWVNEGAETLGLRNNPPKKLPAQNESNSAGKSANLNCYIIFLTGVGDFSTNELTPGEEFFLENLGRTHPNCVVVSDVFPYSAANRDLAAQRVLAPLWDFAYNADGWLQTAGALIQIRNLWRFAISADRRYGPIYNQGIADAIIERMGAAQPIPQESGQPLKIILIGHSGGAQVSLAAAPYLDDWLDAQITVISVGGVFTGTKGFNAVERVYHLQGSRDWIEDIGNIVFPSRWPWTVGSPFNQAQRQGDYQVFSSGSHTHSGPQGYFGEDQVRSNNITYVELTLQQVNQLPIWSSKQQPSSPK